MLCSEQSNPVDNKVDISATMSKSSDLRSAQNAPSSPSRPISSESYFADSAINMDMSTSITSTPLKSQSALDALPSTSSHLFERLTRLAATTWAAEEGGQLHHSTVSTLHACLDRFETHIEGVGEEVSEPEASLNRANSEKPQAQKPLEEVSQEILTHLTTTVSSLRLRHQEHRHLLELSTSRLKTVAQRCLAQERAIQSLTDELRASRNENIVLGRENDGLHTEVEELKSRNTEKDVAMEAMTGAVLGLEGWVENISPPAIRNADDPNLRRGRRREGFRGRGRFRGKYYLDEPGYHGLPLVSENDIREMHEGVKAWLRGFRDIEEGSKARGTEQGFERPRKSEDIHEEWGDFESAC